MTGQVKEMILARFGELGVEIEEGRVRFRPTLLRRTDFLAENTRLRAIGPDGTSRAILVPAASLAFTYCQVPIVYALSDDGATIRVTGGDGTTSTSSGDRLDAATSRALFACRGEIARIDVGVPTAALREDRESERARRVGGG